MVLERNSGSLTGLKEKVKKKWYKIKEFFCSIYTNYIFICLFSKFVNFNKLFNFELIVNYYNF